MTSVAYVFCKQTTEPVSTSQMHCCLLLMIHQGNGAKRRKIWKNLFSSRNGWTASQYNIGRTWPTPHTGHISIMFLAFTIERAHYFRCIESTRRYSVFVLPIHFFFSWFFHWKMNGRWMQSFRNIWMNTSVPFSAHSSDKIKPISCWRHCVEYNQNHLTASRPSLNDPQVCTSALSAYRAFIFQQRFLYQRHECQDKLCAAFEWNVARKLRHCRQRVVWIVAERTESAECHFHHYFWSTVTTEPIPSHLHE